MWGMGYPQYPMPPQDPLMWFKQVDELKEYLKKSGKDKDDKDKDDKKWEKAVGEFIERTFLLFISIPFVVLTWNFIGWGFEKLFGH